MVPIGSGTVSVVVASQKHRPWGEDQRVVEDMKQTLVSRTGGAPHLICDEASRGGGQRRQGIEVTLATRSQNAGNLFLVVVGG